MKQGFTLIEVLVVVAIIALLTAILIPSLSRAREQARIVACQSNMSGLSKAVFVFAAEHRGYGQLVPSSNDKVTSGSVSRDPEGRRYEYEQFSISSPRLKMWPVAYAKQLGIKSLKSNSQYFDSWDPSPTTANHTDVGYYISKFGLKEMFLCPSDKVRLNGLTGGMKVGMFSYGINEDLFGAAGGPPPYQPGDTCYRTPPGAATDTRDPWKTRRLDGKMDEVDRPSEVAMFADSGRNEGDDWGKQGELISTPPQAGEIQVATVNRQINGPYLENFDAVRDRLARYRHGRNGVSVALSDGSGKFARALGWVDLTSTASKTKSYVSRFGPKVRVSPYGDSSSKTTQP